MLRARPCLAPFDLPVTTTFSRTAQAASWRLRDKGTPVMVGIAGIPKPGKSSLVSALAGLAAGGANCPFTTIEPSVAVVPVDDHGSTP